MAAAWTAIKPGLKRGPHYNFLLKNLKLILCEALYY